LIVLVTISTIWYLGVFQITRRYSGLVKNQKPAMAILLLGWVGFNFLMGLILLFDRIEGMADFDFASLALPVGLTFILCALNMIINMLLTIKLVFTRSPPS
jgi:hypothetical protein